MSPFIAINLATSLAVLVLAVEQRRERRRVRAFAAGIAEAGLDPAGTARAIGNEIFRSIADSTTIHRFSILPSPRWAPHRATFCVREPAARASRASTFWRSIPSAFPRRRSRSAPEPARRGTASSRFRSDGIAKSSIRRTGSRSSEREGYRHRSPIFVGGCSRGS